MKKLILGAVSLLALSAVLEVQAQPTLSTTQAVPPVNKPIPAVTAPLKNIAPPSMAQVIPAKPQPSSQPPVQGKMKKLTPPKHPKHHKRSHAPSMPLAQVVSPYLAFPPAQGCNLQYYQGVPSYPYAYHGEYFWYPQAQENLLTGYNPSYWNGYYWYASRLHPHMLYVEGQGATYVVPFDGHAHGSHNHPMMKPYPTAPVAKLRTE